MRSCLRIVDAPSTPISSAIATRSAGVFFFRSFKCIKSVFSWGVVLELVKVELVAEGGRTPRMGTAGGQFSRKLAGSRRDSRYVSPRALSISREAQERRND